MTPITAEEHVWYVGLLIEQLRSIEYSARVAIRMLSEAAPTWDDLAALHEGDSVPENAATNYEQLDAVLKRFNQLAPVANRVDVGRIVELRHQLAHGRLVSMAATRSTRDHFPLVTVKFGKPRSGRVQVTARIEMTKEWFADQRRFLDRTLSAIGFAQGPALLESYFARFRQPQTDSDEGRRR